MMGTLISCLGALNHVVGLAVAFPGVQTPHWVLKRWSVWEALKMNHVTGILILGVSGSLYPNSYCPCQCLCHLMRSAEPWGANLTHLSPSVFPRTARCQAPPLLMASSSPGSLAFFLRMRRKLWHWPHLRAPQSQTWTASWRAPRAWRGQSGVPPRRRTGASGACSCQRTSELKLSGTPYVAPGLRGTVLRRVLREVEVRQ